MSLVQAVVDIDQLTDWIGLPLAAVLLGLLLFLDLKELDPEAGPAIAFLARRRTVVMITAGVGLVFLAVVTLRVSKLAA